MNANHNILLIFLTLPGFCPCNDIRLTYKTENHCSIYIERQPLFSMLTEWIPLICDSFFFEIQNLSQSWQVFSESWYSRTFLTLRVTCIICELPGSEDGNKLWPLGYVPGNSSLCERRHYFVFKTMLTLPQGP